MSTINIPVVAYLAYGSTANFRFRGRIAKINISKEWQGYGDRSSPRLLEIDPVILKVIAIFPGAKICNKLLVSKNSNYAPNNCDLLWQTFTSILRVVSRVPDSLSWYFTVELFILTLSGCSLKSIN